MTLLDEWLKSAQTHLLGPSCLLCRAPATLARELCRDCERELPRLTRACRHCAEPLAADATNPCCGHCAVRPRFDSAHASFAYEQPIRWLITRLKFNGRLAHARLLGDLLADALRERSVEAPDMLVPVPLHKASYRRRGFNQAERLAQRVARTLERPVAARLVERLRDTPRQSTLSARQRATNIRNAFACTSRIEGAHVAIVDDVVTTGQTALALKHCLREAGAARVDLYCVARA